MPEGYIKTKVLKLNTIYPLLIRNFFSRRYYSLSNYFSLYKALRSLRTLPFSLENPSGGLI